jgi:hypothetical protein
MKKAVGIGLSMAVVLALVMAPGAIMAEQADITGTWEMEVETPGGSGNPTFELQQQGEKITGTYQGLFGQSPVTGNIQGDHFVLQFNSAGMDIRYEGIVAGDTAEGSVDIGGGKGTFKGRKK